MTQIGTIYVPVKGDTTQFQKDMANLRTWAYKSGTEVANALNSSISKNTAGKGITDLSNNLKQLAQGAKVPLGQFKTAADALSDSLEDLAKQAGMTKQDRLGRQHAGEAPRTADAAGFSRQVGDMLGDIPYGSTTTYGELALALGNRALAQRVGQAVGHNPVSIIIPCHRVVGADGSLTGYAGGLDRKRALLSLEEPEPAAAGRLF